MVHCSVPGCFNSFKKQKKLKETKENAGENNVQPPEAAQGTSDLQPTLQNKVSFHTFPKDTATRRLWIHKIRRDPGENFEVSSYCPSGPNGLKMFTPLGILIPSNPH